MRQLLTAEIPNSPCHFVKQQGKRRKVDGIWKLQTKYCWLVGLHVKHPCNVSSLSFNIKFNNNADGKNVFFSNVLKIIAVKDVCLLGALPSERAILIGLTRAALIFWGIQNFIQHQRRQLLRTFRRGISK